VSLSITLAFEFIRSWFVFSLCFLYALEVMTLNDFLINLCYHGDKQFNLFSIFKEIFNDSDV